MSNFRFIETGLDVSAILQQVLDNPDDWGGVKQYDNLGGDKNPYGFLPLVMAVVDPSKETSKDAERQQQTFLWPKYTEIHKFLASRNIQSIGRAAFFRLKVGGSLGRHADDGKYYQTRDRYHLSLQGQYDYEVDGEWHTIQPGTFFWFNSKKVHQSINSGDIDRITFVFDVPMGPNNP